jgi:hypothetical protein
MRRFLDHCVDQVFACRMALRINFPHFPQYSAVRGTFSGVFALVARRGGHARCFMRAQLWHHADWHHPDGIAILTLALGVVIGTVLATAF